jgi:TolA-binding protein
VLRGDQLVEEKSPDPKSPEAKLLGAHELFRRGDYEKAGDLFHALRDKKKYPERVQAEATFYEAECLRLQQRYPKACDTYRVLLRDYPSNPYREQTAQHLFAIAYYWLEDTRAKMKQAKSGKWTAPDLQLVHFEKAKPLMDEEGRAIEALDAVHIADIDGSMGLADRALFYAGAVKFFDQDYRDAEMYLTEIHEKFPNSKLAPDAVELAIVAKTLATGGADYDGRKVAEARLLIDAALNKYPTLRDKKEEFLKKLMGIDFQQAEKDFRMAEYWRRTSHPASAWWYYKLILRRYPNTPQAEQSKKRMEELRVKLEKQGKPIPDDNAPAPAPPADPAPKNEEEPLQRRPSTDITPPGPLPPGYENGRPLR